MIFTPSHVDLTPAGKLGLTNCWSLNNNVLALPKSELPLDCLCPKHSDGVLILMLIFVRCMYVYLYKAPE